MEIMVVVVIKKAVVEMAEASEMIIMVVVMN